MGSAGVSIEVAVPDGIEDALLGAASRLAGEAIITVEDAVEVMFGDPGGATMLAQLGITWTCASTGSFRPMVARAA